MPKQIRQDKKRISIIDAVKDFCATYDDGLFRSVHRAYFSYIQDEDSFNKLFVL